MLNIFSILVLVALLWLAAFFEWPVILWTIFFGLAFFLLGFFGFLSLPLLMIGALIFLPIAALANLKTQRMRFFTTPLCRILRKQMPKISDTEKIAIEAGDTWWEKDLFSGKIQWQKLFSLPKPALSAEEQRFLEHQVEHLCALINDWQIVFEAQDLSPAVWDYLKKEKFFGIVIPKEYDGLGFSALAHSTIVTKIATRSISVAVTTMVPNSLGPAELLLHYGTEEQKKRYLPRLATGVEIPCFALTNPEAGSDAGSIPDIGIVCKQNFEGNETIGVRVNWDKRYITLAPIATVIGLAFHLYDPDHLLGDQEDIGITLCLIPATHPGVEVGDRHFPMYLAFMNGPTRGRDVFIPLDWIIGGAKNIGQGWRMLMECLSIGRSISLPALATACGKLTYRLTGAYARVRRQFNTPLAYFEGIEEALGYIAGATYLLESCRIMTAGAIDQKINPAIVSAIAKYQMTEMSRQVIEKAMDIHAGQMIQVGPRNFLANIYFAVPISITVEGANILTRNLIIFGQGAIRCHPYLLSEIELINSEENKIDELDRLLMSHAGFFTSHVLRSFAFGLTGGYFIRASFKNKKINYYQRQLTRMSTALALLADTSLILLGGNLKRKECISARLGDLLSQLYLSSSVLKYFKDNGEPDSDETTVCYALSHCLALMQKAIDGIIQNFPKPIIGKLLRFIIFPLGRAYYPPSDRMTHVAVKPMISPSPLRERMTQYCYIGKNEADYGVRLDKGLQEVHLIDPLIKKINQAVQNGEIPSYYDKEKQIDEAVKKQLITREDGEQMKAFESLKDEIIKVNEFSFNLETVVA